MPHQDFDEPQFLQPAHCHDPTHVSHIAAIPAAFLYNIPTSAQLSLWKIQESTSVAFASYSRLQALAKGRFGRLVPAKNQTSHKDRLEYSEPAFQNYVNSLQAEKLYFLEEALVDWRHKAMRVDLGGHHDLPFRANGKEITLQRWWAALKDAVEKWVDEVEDIEIPDFEETVAEYRIFQAKEIRKNNAREERNRRRKTMLDLDKPDFGDRARENIESAVETG